MKDKTMRRLAAVIPFLVVFLLISTSAIAAQCRVTYVFDGDTLLCRLEDISIKIRLAGIDAPEAYNKKRKAGQPYNIQARRYLTGRVLNKVVDIKGYGLDAYNRILGELFIEGKNVNLELIQMGLAEVYKGELSKDCDLDTFMAAEKEAKELQKGIWGLGDRYVSPNDWRNENR